MQRGINKLLGAVALAFALLGCAPGDVEIGSKVKSNLSADKNVNASSIEVGVQKKTVTLTGTVDTAATKEQAVEIARKTEGVAGVVDQLVVKGPGFGGPAHGREMMGRGMEGGEHARPPKTQQRQ
jgi:osmotically-inducible protein OsmY